MNDYKLNRSCIRQLTENEKKSIQRRQELALMYRAKEKIEDYQNDVFSIIEQEGLKNEESKVKLETALKVLPYIIPTKKAIETTVIHRKLEDIISESIEEAQIIEDGEDQQQDKQGKKCDS